VNPRVGIDPLELHDLALETDRLVAVELRGKRVVGDGSPTAPTIKSMPVAAASLFLILMVALLVRHCVHLTSFMFIARKMNARGMASREEDN